MRKAITIALIGIATLAMDPRSARACQEPPENVECHLTPELPVVTPGQPFKVFMTVTNFPSTAPFPPPYLDDLDWSVTVLRQDPTTTGFCWDLGDPGFSEANPSSYTMVLDEAWSPHADGPTSHVQELIIDPLVTGAWYGVAAQACGGVMGCLRGCQPEICIPASSDPTAEPTPTGQFLEPLKADAAGAAVPFRLRVLRNGYTAGRPLTVRVRPENRSDPLDIFPIEPVGLTTTGVTVLGDDETLDFQCRLHYPCLVGVDNIYHVTIHDGATLLWDSSIRIPTGIGRALVDRSPMARQEIVEILDDGQDGRIATGEHAVIHLRLYGRNPFLDATLTGVTIEAPYPAELTFVSDDLHNHDNPMDSEDPTPAELEAFGTVVSSAGNYLVEPDPMIARFAAPPFTGPAIFRDLFEIELFLETPPDGLASARFLDFPGVRVTGTADGVAHDQMSAPMAIEIHAGMPPNAVAPLFAVRRGSDVGLVFDDPAVDSEHGPATRYEIWRSVDAPDGWTSHDVVDDSAAAREEWLDPDPGAGALHHYRLVAHNGDGPSGDRP